MVIIDTNFIYRNLFHKVDGNESFFRNQFLQHIVSAKIKYSNRYGEVVLATSSGSWRNNIIKDYNIKPETKENENNFLYIYNEMIEIIKNNTNIKVINVKSAEAFDVMFSLSSIDSENLFYTGSKNAYQYLKFGKVYDINQKQMLEESLSHSKTKLKQEIAIGDKRKNIQNIVWNSQPSDAFYNWYLSKYNKSLSKELFQEAIYDKDLLLDFKSETGSNPYKKIQFGEKTIEKIISNDELMKLIESNPIIEKNYKINKLLLDVSQTPKQLSEEIIRSYREYNRVLPNLNQFIEYLDLYDLENLKMKLSSFY